MRRGAISISIATATSVIAGSVAAVIWIVNYVNQAVVPVAAEADADHAAIVGINTNLEWIKAALETNGIKPNASFLKQNP